MTHLMNQIQQSRLNVTLFALVRASFQYVLSFSIYGYNICLTAPVFAYRRVIQEGKNVKISGYNLRECKVSTRRYTPPYILKYSVNTKK